MQDASIIIRGFQLEDFGLQIRLQNHPSVDICPALSSQALLPPQLLCLAGVVRQKTKRQKGTEKLCHVTSRYVL